MANRVVGRIGLHAGHNIAADPRLPAWRSQPGLSAARGTAPLIVALVERAVAARGDRRAAARSIVAHRRRRSCDGLCTTMRRRCAAWPPFALRHRLLHRRLTWRRLDVEYPAAVKRTASTRWRCSSLDDVMLVLGIRPRQPRPSCSDGCTAGAAGSSTAPGRCRPAPILVRVWGVHRGATRPARAALRECRACCSMPIALLFSDTWCGRRRGRRYVLGQASLLLPAQ